MSAPVLWFTALTLAALVVVGVLAMDFRRWLKGEQTISRWLRRYPRWFWWPLAVTLLLLAVLYVHLFVWPFWKG